MKYFSMRRLLLSCLWALFESRFWIIFPISSAEKKTVDRRLSLISLKLAGRELFLGIREHCLEKKELKNLAFSQNQLGNNFRKTVGVQIIFSYYLRKLLIETNIVYNFSGYLLAYFLFYDNIFL